MSDSTTITRLLKFISLLSSTYKRTAQEYAALLKVNKSTISRYKNTLEEVGYVIHKNENHQLFIDKANPQLDAQLRFNEEETQLIAGLLRASGSPKQQDLLQKVYFNSPLPALADSAESALLAKKYRLLREAIRKEQQVLLLSYASMNGSEKRDRKVEPIRFRRKDKVLEAFEVESRQTKHFHLERLADVRQLYTPFQHKDEHQNKPTDPFHIADVPQAEIILLISSRAAQRLKEEFEDSHAYLREESGQVYYQGPVNEQFINLDRWLMAWCDEVQILQPESLRQHLAALWEKRKF
ncbi:MAG: helix-turn-helix transcriptional regulator [Cyclobacteriaceae bacterium]